MNKSRVYNVVSEALKRCGFEPRAELSAGAAWRRGQYTFILKEKSEDYISLGFFERPFDLSKAWIGIVHFDIIDDEIHISSKDTNSIKIPKGDAGMVLLEAMIEIQEALS